MTTDPVLPATRFRKKPVVIDAARIPEFLGSSGQPELYDVVRAIAVWCGGNLTLVGHQTCIEIATLEGVMLAKPGDWVLRGVKGEFYPCRADIFTATYEPVPTGE